VRITGAMTYDLSGVVERSGSLRVL